MLLWLLLAAYVVENVYFLIY